MLRADKDVKHYKKKSVAQNFYVMFSVFVLSFTESAEDKTCLLMLRMISLDFYDALKWK